MLKENELTAYCGLYCGDCMRYQSRTSDLARDLLIELQNEEFVEYAKSKSSSAKQFNPIEQFRHYEKCCEVLEAIVTLQCNEPCRVGNGCPNFSCNILECCRRERFDGCWQCNEFERCEKFEQLTSIHGDSPKKNLWKIRELGIDKWVKHRSKPYVWQA